MTTTSEKQTEQEPMEPVEALEEAAENAEGMASSEPESQDGAQAQANLEKELEETRAHLLRALAETENIRKRAERDRQDIQQYAVTNFARDMLSVLDNLARAIQVMQSASQGAPQDFLEGIVMTEKELLKVFEKYKITPVDALQKPFDPHLHQAVCEIETADQPAGTVVQVMQSGYQIGDRLLRPAMVGVAKAPTA